MSKSKELVIEKMIYIIRDQKVMLDSDLAELYKVDTKVLNQAVKRNLTRFPQDFMFQLTSEECDFLRSQFVTSKIGRGGRRYMPYVFTENGVAMLSSVLSSEKAIQINVSIMRIFTRLRSFLMLEKDLSDRVTKLEQGTNQMFKVVFERLDNYEEMVTPKLPGNRKKVGLK
jgi:hypothetical protein